MPSLRLFNHLTEVIRFLGVLIPLPLRPTPNISPPVQVIFFSIVLLSFKIGIVPESRKLTLRAKRGAHPLLRQHHEEASYVLEPWIPQYMVGA